MFMFYKVDVNFGFIVVMWEGIEYVMGVVIIFGKFCVGVGDEFIGMKIIVFFLKNFNRFKKV